MRIDNPANRRNSMVAAFKEQTPAVLDGASQQPLHPVRQVTLSGMCGKD